MTNSEKYEIVGNLIESPTQYDMVRALLVYSAPGGSVSRIKDGIQIEDLAQARIDGRDMGISPEHVENIYMTVAEFCKLLIDLVDAGGMKGFWPGKIKISFHIRGWTDLPVE
ncbi:hypothetical protein EDC59_101408 [Pseudodesulfovibrio indicus]|nr:hypothetical protein [Pseudodesulfovibrio indicus]TDT92004.1 hypothetical protein EDC59_101408 [Pseudodesulfovibrio indicus]